MTAVPFRRCDKRNLGISRFCTLTDPDVPKPPIFGHDLINEFFDEETKKFIKLPAYVAEKRFGTNLRYGKGIPHFTYH